MIKGQKKEVSGETSTAIVAEKEPTVNTFDAEKLINTAIEQKVPVETMERLLAMRRELKGEWAKEQYDRAMAAFQSECPTIEKKKKVSFNTTNYSYAPLEDIVEQVKPLLAKNGFSYTFDTKEAENGLKIICYAKHIDGHSEPSSLEIAIDGAAKMNKTQQYGSANSYGKRYAFCNAFGILTGDEDTDARPIEANATPLAKLAQPTQSPLSNLTLMIIRDLQNAKTNEDYLKISTEITIAHQNRGLSNIEYSEIVKEAKLTVKRIQANGLKKESDPEEPSGAPFDDVKPAYDDEPAKANLRAKFGK